MQTNEYAEAFKEIRIAAAAAFEYAKTEEEVCELERAMYDTIHSIINEQSTRLRSDAPPSAPSRR